MEGIEEIKDKSNLFLTTVLIIFGILFIIGALGPCFGATENLSPQEKSERDWENIRGDGSRPWN